MELLVSYDIATDTAGGPARLRKTARICEGYGQRVQKSVFECRLTLAYLEQLIADLTEVIDADHDTVRIYRLREPRDTNLWKVGRDLAYDTHEPLII